MLVLDPSLHQPSHIEVLRNLIPHVLHISESHEVLSYRPEHIVILISMELFDWDSVVDLKHVVRHLVVHNNYIFEFSIRK